MCNAMHRVLVKYVCILTMSLAHHIQEDPHILLQLPPSQSHSRVITCEQPKLVPQFAGVSRPKTTWMQA